MRPAADCRVAACRDRRPPAGAAALEPVEPRERPAGRRRLLRRLGRRCVLRRGQVLHRQGKSFTGGLTLLTGCRGGSGVAACAAPAGKSAPAGKIARSGTPGRIRAKPKIVKRKSEPGRRRSARLIRSDIRALDENRSPRENRRIDIPGTKVKQAFRVKSSVHDPGGGGTMAETEGFEPSIGLYNPITV